MKLRSKVAELLAEFLGTAVLVTIVINIARSQIGVSYFVAIGVGLAMALLILAIGRVSGAHVNPAVTLSLWTVRKIDTLKAIAYIAAQMLGGLVAWQLANYFSGQEIMSIAPAEFDWKVLVAEAIGTFVFIFLLAAAIYQDSSEGKKAALIGGGLALGIIVASIASMGGLNPAVALGNQMWSKAYIFGPLVGGVIGMNLYVLFFAPVSELSAKPKKASKLSGILRKSKSTATVVSKPAVAKKSSKATSKAKSSTRAKEKKTVTKRTSKKK